jgi:glycosyltransferase involved in cell wall biosynthesis
VKLLVVIPFYKPAHCYGGPVSCISLLCEEMVRQGAEVTVFTTTANGYGKHLEVPTGQAVEVNGVKVVYFRCVHLFFYPLFFYTSALRRALRAALPTVDVCYTVLNWNYPTSLAASCARRLGVPYVMGPHGCLMDWSTQQYSGIKQAYLRLFERRLLDGAAFIHCASEMESAQTRRLQLRAPLRVVPNGLPIIALERLPARGALRQQLGIPPAARVCLFVGRLQKIKRLDLVARVFGQAHRDCPDSHLVLAGADEDESLQTVREIARRDGVAEYVHYAGLLPQAELLQAYVDADVLLLLSRRENFGMVVAEALAAQRPVLVSSGVGLAPEITRAGCGRVVAGDQEAEIVTALVQMLQNPDERAEMGRRGRQLMLAKYASGAVAAAMLREFGQVARPAVGRSAG